MRIYPKIVPVLFLAVILIFGLRSGASADRGIPSPYEEELLRMINDARQDPLAMAELLGMDAEQILQDLPELRDILTGGLSPLAFSENLYEAASGHTEDMIAGNYYSHDSPDGRGYNDRIADAGYAPAPCGESLGMLAFANFIDPAEAVRVIFENIFMDELDPAGTERRNILDPDMREAGIALKTGAFDLGGAFCNVYLAACDFGSGMAKMEMELLNLINQARSNPLGAAASAGLDPDRLLADNPGLCDIIDRGGLPPLTFNGNLYAAACAHAGDMLENEYYSRISLDGRTWVDRMRENGYDPAEAGESIGIGCLGGDAILEERAWTLFRNILKTELCLGAVSGNILNPDIKEAGISLIAGTSGELGGICGDKVLLMTADFGAGAEEKAPVLAGFVYSDLNGDGLYGMGEGMGRVAVEIEGESGRFSLYTNEAGGFSITLAPGAHRLAVMAGEEEMLKYIDLGSENRLVVFRSCPVSD